MRELRFRELWLPKAPMERSEQSNLRCSEVAALHLQECLIKAAVTEGIQTGANTMSGYRRSGHLQMGCARTDSVAPEFFQAPVEEQRSAQRLRHAASATLCQAGEPQQTGNAGVEALRVHDLLRPAAGSAVDSAQEELPELPWGCTSVHSRGNLPDIINSGLVHLAAETTTKENYLVVIFVIHGGSQQDVACAEATQCDAVTKEELPEHPGKHLRSCHPRGDLAVLHAARCKRPADDLREANSFFPGDKRHLRAALTQRTRQSHSGTSRVESEDRIC